MTGAFVCAALSIVPTVRHADYLASWLEVLREDNRAIIRAASAASKAADYLLAFRDGDPVPENRRRGTCGMTARGGAPSPSRLAAAPAAPRGRGPRGDL